MISRKQLYALGEPLGESCTRRVAGRTLYGSGGGGGGKSTTVQSIPEELKGLASAYANKAMGLSNQPYQTFQGQRYSGPTGAENQGLNMVANRAMNGDPTQRSGANFLQRQLSSGPGSATMNPYGGINAVYNNNQINPATNNERMNAGYNGSQVSGGYNPYMGSNPYLDSAVNRAQSNVVSQFNNMTKPQTEAAMVGSGSFGNSGLQQTLQNQQVAAGKQLGDIASQMYGADYNNTQQLAESGLNRNLQAQQFNSGITDANLGRSMQAQQFNSGLTDANINRNVAAQQFNSGITDANIGRNMQAQQYNSSMGNDWAGRNDAARQNQTSNSLNASQLGLQYGNAAYNDANQLMNAGAYARNFDQQGRDFNFQQYQDQQNLPYKQLAAMSGVFGSNLGGSSTTTSSGGGK